MVRSNSASATKSRSLTASSEFSKAAAKPRSAATPSGSRASDDPARAPAPSGETSSRRRVSSRRSTSRESAQRVGEQVVGQQHRLGPLEVGVAGQVGLAGGLGQLEQHLLEDEHPTGDPDDLALGEEPQIGGHLVVAAATGVQLRAGRAGQLGDPALDHGVDVLVGRQEVEPLVEQLLLDLVEGRQHLVGLAEAEHTGPHQPPHVGPRTGDVVGREALVEREAHGEGEQLLGRTALEATVPERAHRGPPSSRGAFSGSRWACLAAQVWTPRPQSFTKPSESAWLKASSAS